jgi:hypothetical protein
MTSNFLGAGIAALILAVPAIAQDQLPQSVQPTQNTQQLQPVQQNLPTVCQTDDNFHMFDFWVGTWRVQESVSGKFAGTNSIQIVEGGCAILGMWKSATNDIGVSINHYDPSTGKWRQLWVSAGAYSIDIEGGLLSRSMALKGTISYFKTSKRFPFRGTWTPLSDGTVRQHFEQFDPEKGLWTTWFDGIYTRTAKIIK